MGTIRALAGCGAATALGASLLLVAAPAAQAQTGLGGACVMPSGDLDDDGDLDPADTLCARDTLRAVWFDAPLPACLVGAPGGADLDCDGNLTFRDYLFFLRLGQGASAGSYDADKDGCIDACQLDTCFDGAPCGAPEDACPGQPCGDGADACLTETWLCGDDGGLACVVEPVYCDNGAFCDGQEVCDAAVGCVVLDAPEVDDGIDCTWDGCDETVQDVFHVPADSLCEDTDPCTFDACEPALGGCTHTLDPAVDDGIPCTLDGCDPATGEPFHEPVDALCPQFDVCHPLVCDAAAGGCVLGEGPPGLDDGIDCTVDECDFFTGVISHTPVDALCPDQGPCAVSTCDLFEGCLVSDPPDLDDGIECTVDICDAGTGDYLYFPVDFMCEDGLPCTLDTCVVGLGCESEAPTELDDDNPCTVDLCDEAGGITHTPDDSLCDNGLFCDGAETCDADTGCVPGEAPVTDDLIDCTEDHCDEATDTVSHTPLDALCADPLFCNGAEVCVPAKGGCQSGPPPDPDDGNDCTFDQCDEASDGFLHLPQDWVCDDLLYCNGDELCDEELGCLPGSPPAELDDHIACTEDHCDEDTGVVTHVASHAACDDGLYCDGAELCDVSAGGCVDGPAPDPDDGVDCTVDECDEATDTLVHAPQDALCDNGVFCDGAETCDPDAGCQGGAQPNVDDQIECTFDFCDKAADEAAHIPDDELCDNGLFCDGAEACVPGEGCVAGADPGVDDQIECTVDDCDEDSDTISHLPIDAMCDNHLYCDGVEVCVPGQGCVSGAGPDPDDSNDCTVDSCDEGTDALLHEPDHGLCSTDLLCAVGICDPSFKGGGCIVELVPLCCGNALTEAGETCDDGNLDAGDGCDPECQLEPEWPICPLPDTSCVPFADPPGGPLWSRWVGLLTADHVTPGSPDPCPYPKGDLEPWQFGALFQPLPPALAQLGPPEAFVDGADGGTLCVYEWFGPAPHDEIEVAVLEQQLPTEDFMGMPLGPWLEPDKPVVVPLGDAAGLRSSVKAALHAHARAHVGALDALPVAAMPGPPVMIAVLDTALPGDVDGGTPGAGQSPHGRDVGAWIRELACPSNDATDATCAAVVTTHLALHLEPDGLGGSVANYAEGGYYGTPTQVARAAWDAIALWATMPAGTQLVLNLSIGWEDDPAGQPATSLASSAVRAVLAWATCAGAFNVAAAGNERLGPVPGDGPMLPAGFETSAAPACAPGLTSYKAIVHAAGGLDGLGRALANTRPGGRPLFAAYAHQITADTTFLVDAAAGEATFDGPSLTGSSMGAAALSAAAAVAWFHDQPRANADVAQALFDASAPLPDGAGADFCASSAGCPAIRRVSICDALAATYGVGAPPCPGAPLGDPQWPAGGQDDAAALSTATVALGPLEPYFMSECQFEGSFALMIAPDLQVLPLYPCPQRQLYNEIPQPQVDPQPRGPGCDVCAFDPLAGVLTVMVSETLAGDGPIDEVRLILTAASGAVKVFPIGGPYAAGDVITVTGIDTSAVPFDVVEMAGVVAGYSGRALVRQEQIPVQGVGAAL